MEIIVSLLSGMVAGAVIVGFLLFVCKLTFPPWVGAIIGFLGGGGFALLLKSWN